MERSLTGLVALLLFGALAAFFLYIPIVPMILVLLILTGLVLMFLLGVYVSTNVELRLLAQAKRMPADAASGSAPASSTSRTDSAALTGPQNGDFTTGQQNSPKSPNGSTKLAARAWVAKRDPRGDQRRVSR
jgi:hypothetical protein